MTASHYSVKPAPTPNVVVDIWGGRNSSAHVARSYLPLPLALQVAEQELLAGFLVNLRAERVWGPEENFDHRQKAPPS